MGKFVTDLPSKDPERAVEKVETYLERQGFVRVGRPDKEVWRRAAKTKLLSPEYISIAPRGEEHVRLQAWIKAITPVPGVWVGNTNPEKGALVGSASKERLRNRITQVEKIVAGERPTRR